jgi:hypothetical protein
MTNTQLEKKILTQVLALIRSPEIGARRRRGAVLLSCAFALVALVTVYLLAASSTIGPRMTVAAAATTGFILGAASYMGESIRRWPIFSEHLQATSIEKRLSELQT